MNGARTQKSKISQRRSWSWNPWVLLAGALRVQALVLSPEPKKIYARGISKKSRRFFFVLLVAFSFLFFSCAHSFSTTGTLIWYESTQECLSDLCLLISFRFVVLYFFPAHTKKKNCSRMEWCIRATRTLHFSVPVTDATSSVFFFSFCHSFPFLFTITIPPPLVLFCTFFSPFCL